MKTKLRKFGAWLMAAALAFAGAGAYGETVQVADQTELNAAVKAAAAGDVIEITVAATYKVPSPTSAIKIVGVDGVVFNAIDTNYGQSVGQATGTEFVNVKFAFGTSLYTGFQHSSYVAFTKCSFTGRFNSYGEMHFTECSFEAPSSDYSMWLYAGDTYFKDCTFSGNGKFFNVYNEGNTSVPWIVEFDGCTFSSTAKNKAALNVKSTCGSKGLKYDVKVNNCTVNENFPAASVSDTLIVFNGLIQLDDISASTPNEITITQDGKVLYADNEVAGPEVAIKEPTKEEVVEKAETKGEVSVEQKTVKAEEVVAVIAKAVEEEALEVAKSGLSAAGKTVDGKLADALVTALKAAAAEEKKDEITKETKVKKTIDVVFKGMTVEAGESVTTTKISYDVTPKATVTLSDKTEVSTPIPNDTFEKINFRMPLTADFAGRWLKVSRTDNGTDFVNVGLYLAQKEGDVDFVQIDGDHFTTYVNEISDVTPVASINGKGYTTLQAAVDAAKAGETVKLQCDIEQTDDLILLEKNIVIDFADKKLLVKTGIRVLSDVTFRNGTLDLSAATGSGHGGNTAHPGSNLTSIWTMNAHLTLEGMTFSAVDVQAAYMVEMSAPSTIDFKDSVVSLDGINIGFWLNPNCGIRIEDSQVSVKHMRGGSGSGFIYGSDYSACSLALVNSSVTVSDSVAGAKAKGITLCGPMTVAKSTIVGKDLNNCLIQYCTPVLTDGSSITMDNTDGIEQSSLTVNAGCSVVGVGTGSRDHFGYTQLPGSVLKAGAIVNVDEITFYYNTADLTVEAGADVTVRTKLDVSSAIPHAGSVKIAGGKYNNLVQAGSTKRLDITGGLYKVKPADGYVNPYYEAVENEDESTKAEGYLWKVVPKPSVAEMLDAEGQSIGEIYSFELALEQVPTNGTIKILVDNATFAITDTGKSFKINQNGHELGTITVPTGYELKNNAGVLTFRKTPIATITRGSDVFEYDSLAAACAAAQSGDVIQLAALEIDATNDRVIKDLTGKTVTVKGAGLDKTTLLWGNGKKYGTADGNSYLTGANITIEDLALTITHNDSMPYDEWMVHPASQTFRNVKINGQAVTMNPAVFESCTFTGPVNKYDEYLIWIYNSHALVSNCTFKASGSHAPIKLFNQETYNKCSVTVVDTTFEAVGDEHGAITTASNADNFAYDIQVDVDSVTVPAGATLIGYDPNYGSRKVNMVNGTTDANGKYTSGAIFSDRGTDEQILAIVAKIVADGYTALPYVGPATKLGNFRWYIGQQQQQPTVDPDAEKPTYESEFPEEKKAENNEDTRQKIQEQTSNVTNTLESAAITKFTDTNVEKTLFDDEGKVTQAYKAALANATENEAVKAAINASSSDSNTVGAIKINLKEMSVGVRMASADDVVATLNKVSYDVKPVLVTEVTYKDGDEVKSETVKTEITEELLGGNPITFRLAVGKEFVGQAQVLHYSDDAKQYLVEDYYTPVLGEDDNKYVQIKSVKFSPFDVLNANAVQLACKVGDNMYATIADAIAASEDAYDTTIELLKDIDPTVVVNGLGMRVIDRNGKEFLSSQVTPDDGKEVVAGADGTVYVALPAVSVQVEDGKYVKVRGYTAFPADVMTPDAKGDYLKAKPEGASLARWQTFAMGVSETAKVVPQIVGADEGSSTVVIKADFPALNPPTRCGVKTVFRLMQAIGTQTGYSQYGADSDVPHFQVDVKEIAEKTFWKIQTSFQSTEVEEAEVED